MPARVGRSPKNKTLSIQQNEITNLRKNFLSLPQLDSKQVQSGVYNGDFRNLIKAIPKGSVKLLIMDPPYNLSKEFNKMRFSRRSVQEYSEWLEKVLADIAPVLSNDATIYICGDWFSSISIFQAASQHFVVRNRITWEREKGRGSLSNWKNSSEDIWFCTVSDTYIFNVDQVKLRRKVVAPYRDQNGAPKDWVDTANGAFRDTHPSNIWTDITIPFWSMPENTEHPTQKSEKLIAKLILASSNAGDLVLDPFMGSGTTCVVAKKLGRNYLGAEIDEEFCLLAQKRLQLADKDKRIQGYSDRVFWERNTLAEQMASASESESASED